MSSGCATKRWPTARRSETTRAPARSPATACARASCREAWAPRLRNGCGTARRAPRSGHVPTTTSAPRARRRVIASARSAADEATGTRCVTSFPPTMTTATSGRYVSGSQSIWRARSCDSAPTCAAVRRRTGRCRNPATLFAIRAPRTSLGRSAPSPAAMESPTMSSSTGVPPSFGRHTRSASRAISPSGFPIRRRATAACRVRIRRAEAVATRTAPTARPAASAGVRGVCRVRERATRGFHRIHVNGR